MSRSTTGTKLTLVPTIAQSTNAYDFVTPTQSLASLELLQKHEMEASRTFRLRQISQHRQTLTPLSDPNGTSFVVKASQTGGFMNRKPHMLIQKDHDGRNNSVISNKSDSSQKRRRSSIFGSEKEPGKGDLAEVRFEIGESGISIQYKEYSHIQHLALQSALDQSYSCPIQGRMHCWRPLGPSEMVLEFANELGERIALFMYASEVASTTGVGTGRKASLSVGLDVGELHILEDINGGVRAQEEVLCSAMAVVERIKRRAATVGRRGSA